MEQQPFPPQLATIGEEISKLPAVASTSPHTTASGGWGLTVFLNPGAEAPTAQIENVSGEFPVRYDSDYQPPVARPAYPERGE